MAVDCHEDSGDLQQDECLVNEVLAAGRNELMKRIGMVTPAEGNFGSSLQCYATQVILSYLGYTGVLLERKERTRRRLAIRAGRYLQFLVRCVRNPVRLKNLIAVRKQARKLRDTLSDGTRKAIEEFVCEHIRVESASFGELKRLSRTSEYSAFVSGSDQIWNVAGPFRDPMAFLRFAPREKRVAFAPSFGASEISAYDRKELGSYISEYEYLSVRERRGAEIIKDLTGREAEVLVDPTLQLDGSFWRQASAQHSNVNKHNSKYILLYFLSPPSSVAVETIRRVEMGASCAMLAMAYDRSEFQEFEGCRFIDGGPLDFVSLIANAKLVCTDSLHGTTFSINLNTPFLTFDRQYGYYYNQSSRLLSILNICNLDERFITDIPKTTTSLLEMDFTESNRLLDAERKKAISYLSASIESVIAKA